MENKKNFFQDGNNIALVVFAVVMILLFFLARAENRDQAREAQLNCVRESYEMAKQFGGTPKEHEIECLNQYEEDRLRSLSGN